MQAGVAQQEVLMKRVVSLRLKKLVRVEKACVSAKRWLISAELVFLRRGGLMWFVLDFNIMRSKLQSQAPGRAAVASHLPHNLAYILSLVSVHQ